MHPHAECPPWEYKADPKSAVILSQEAARVLGDIHEGTLSIQSAAIDTRDVHTVLFSRLVHPNQSYLAGHYRGEEFKCLKYLKVGILSNSKVGSPPEVVHLHLKSFVKTFKAAVVGLDTAMAIPDAHLSPREKLKYLIAASCRLFSDFLLIHPYANGNGHIARIMLTWLLSRYGYWLTKFPIEPRPKEPDYSEAILRYQSGDIEPLEKLVFLSLLAGS